MDDNPIRYLGEHVNTDRTVRDAVRNYIRQLNAPFTIIELWKPLGIRRENVQRELNRMVKKGLLTRYKIPRIAHKGNRDHYLYSLTEGYE